MNEVEFRNWMLTKGKNRKVISDTVSRLKRIERELNHCDIEVEYCNDRCERLLTLFLNNGENEELKRYKTSFPIGKYYISTYRHAIRMYVDFCDEITLEH